MAFSPPSPPPPSPPSQSLTKWEHLLRQMLPAGAPLPDEDHLDYTISVEYQGPPPLYDKMPNPSRPPHSSSPSTNVFSKPFAKFSSSFRTRKNHSSFSPKNTFNLLPEAYHRYEHHYSSNWDDDNSDVNIKSSMSRSLSALSDLNQICNDKIANEGSDDNNVSSRDGCYGNCNTTTTIRKRDTRIKCCTRCGKGGGRFRMVREKGERCIVCNTIYCRCCILKGMGSMPEGRKCLGCIGRPIDEANRERLGRCSRVLATICSSVEVRQVMKAERECLTNQIRPEQVVLNGWHLRADELAELLGCGNPPKDLRPGRYWYDKNSGFWGKEGKKPDRIISAKLSVGGKLLIDASKGNTNVYFNGREVTKEELKVFKLVNVQCPRGTHFWLYEDGSYEEEGQNNIKGNIWGKAFSRWIFSFYSFPIPPGNPLGQRECTTTFSGRSLPVYLEQRKVQTLLLVGLEGSGTSTIFKQVKFMHGGEFNAEELQAIKIRIRSNLFRYLTVLLEGRDQFEEDALVAKTSCLTTENFAPSTWCTSGENLLHPKGQGSYLMNPRFKAFTDSILDFMTANDMDNFFHATACEYASFVEEVWRDPTIQETYKRREELQYLPDTAKYFLDQAFEILSNEYKPSEEDILYAERVTPSNGLSFFEFTSQDLSPLSEKDNENGEDDLSLTKYQLIRIGSKRLLSGCKWLDMFQSFSAVAFCIALNDYDQILVKETGCVQNRMLASRELFESMVRHPSFEDITFVLLLNKYDAFEEKIKTVPLTACEWFHDFNPLISKSHQSLAHQAYFYIAIKFKQMFTSITGRKLFVCQSRARDRDSVDAAFRYIKEVIKWDEEKNGGGMYRVHDDDEESFCSRKKRSSFHVWESRKLI